MKWFGVLLVILVLLTQVSASQDLWQLQSALKKSNCAALAFSANRYGYAAYNNDPQYTDAKLYRYNEELGISDLVSTGGLNRITAITVDKNNRVFVGTYGTGLITSTDNGGTWITLTVNSNYTDIQAIALSKAGNMFVACGTVGGEHLAMFRSTDGGEQWTSISPTFSYNYVYGIAVGVNENLFASRYDSGIVRTTNNGQSWDVVRPEPASTIIACPNGDLFCANFGPTQLGVSRSTDGGGSWDLVNGGLQDTLISGLCCDSSGNVFCAGPSGIYGFSISGSTWAKVSLNFDSKSPTVLTFDAGQRLFAGTQFDGILRSSDRGISWAPISYPSDNNIPVRAILLRNSRDVFVSADIGYVVYASSDSGHSWHSAIAGLDAYQVAAFAMNQKTGHLYAGSQPSGFHFSSDGGASWTNRISGLTNTNLQALAVNSSGEIYAATYFGGVFRSSNEGQQWQEINEGITYKNIVALQILSDGTILAGGGSVPLGGNAMFCSTDNGDHWHTVLNQAAISFAQTPSGKVFALVPDGYGDHVMVSTDKGENWIDPNQGLTIYGGSALAANSRGDLLVGTNVVGIYISRDEGVHWEGEGTFEQLPTPVGITTIAFDSANVAYVGTTSGLYKSTRPVVTGIGGSIALLPAKFSLEQNFPNPFNPTTDIEYATAGVSDVRLAVYDILGREVAVLVNDRKAPGRYVVRFDGSRLSSGVYFYRLTAGSSTEVRKMTLVR